MTQTLVFYLGQSQDDPVALGRLEDGAVAHVAHAEDFADAVALARDEPPVDRILAILPGEQVIVRRMAAAPASDAKLQAAAALLLEDELAEPIAQVHVVACRQGDQASAIAARASLVEDWVEAFRAAGAALDAMTVDSACLATSDHRLVRVDFGDRTVVAHAGGGFAAEADLAEEALRALARSAPLEDAGAVLADLGRSADCGDPYSVVLAAAGASDEPPPNLLQGRFRERSGARFALSPWRRAAMLGAGLLVSIGMLTVAAAMRDASVAGRYVRAAEEIYYGSHPEARGLDLRADARARLMAARSAADFSTLAAAVGTALADHDAVSIDRIVFDERRRDFVFSVRAASDAAIEAFRSDLRAAGVPVSDASGYRRTGAAWVGDMRVEVP